MTAGEVWSPATRQRLRLLARDARHAVRRRAEPCSTVFVLGCQRSGTTMLLEAFTRDSRVKAFGEFSPLNRPIPGHGRWELRHERRYSIRMRSPAGVAEVLAPVRHPMAVAKPIVESQRAHELLDEVPHSTAIWMFRHFAAVARSNVAKFGPDIGHTNLAPVLRGDQGNWRAEYVPPEVRRTIADYVGPETPSLDAAALFWYLRTRLYLDLGLHRDARVLPLQYEQFVAAPEPTLRTAYQRAGVSWPGGQVCTGIRAQRTGPREAADVQLTEPVRQLCAGLWRQLLLARDDWRTAYG